MGAAGPVELLQSFDWSPIKPRNVSCRASPWWCSPPLPLPSPLPPVTYLGYTLPSTHPCFIPPPIPPQSHHPPSTPHPSIRYLGYNSLKDFFPTMDIKPNPGCTNPLCCK